MEGADFAGKEVVVVFPVTYYFECCRMILGGGVWIHCGLGRLVG